LNKSLLDTDTLSEIGRGINPNVARNATAYRLAFGHYTTSVVSVMEIVRGFQRTSSTRRLQAFVASTAVLEILPFDQPAAELAGRIAGDLERVGRPIGLADPMIAAIALTQSLELITGNTAHFLSVQQLGYPLTLADWRV
jgi:predicted nucleic acid-binding protein